jgi:hypothetical protein
MSNSEYKTGQSGGINITSSNVTTHGPVVGGNYTSTAEISRDQLDQLFGPILAAARTAGHEVQAEAVEKANSLKQEASKGAKADEGQIAKLVDELLELVPGATSAVVSALGSPILGGIAGPITHWVLKKFQAG